MLTTSRRSFIQKGTAIVAGLLGIRLATHEIKLECREDKIRRVMSIMEREQWRCDRDLTGQERRLLAEAMVDSKNPAETGREMLKLMGIDQSSPRPEPKC